MREFENFFDKLRKYCDFELEFDDTNKLFKFNKEYIDAHTTDHFREDTLVFYYEFSRLYDVATDKLKFVEDTITIIKYTTSVFYNKNLLLPQNFKKIKGATVFSTDNPIVTSPHDFTPQSLKEAFENFDENSPKVLAFLLCNPDCPKVYRNQLIVERALLYFVMVEFCESLTYMEVNLEKVIKELKTYQYCKIEDVNPVVISDRCVIPFSKIETAYIFHALFEQGIFTFPNLEDRKFTAKRNKFINRNFIYVDEDNNQIPIKDIKVQFSDIKNLDNVQVARQCNILEILHEKISNMLEESRKQNEKNNNKKWKK